MQHKHLKKIVVTYIVRSLELEKFVSNQKILAASNPCFVLEVSFMRVCLQREVRGIVNLAISLSQTKELPSLSQVCKRGISLWTEYFTSQAAVFDASKEVGGN